MRYLQFLQRFGGFLPSSRCNGSANCAAAATREPSAALAALAEPAAMHNCTFGGNSRASRRPTRRMKYHLCH
ncbi:MAG: hypothetical protein ABI970_18845 [Chloroflexota bacterium]